MFGYSVALAFVCASVRGCVFSSSRLSEAVPVSFEPSSAKAVLLANDTELSVAPKTRQQKFEKKHFVDGETPVMQSDPVTKSATSRKLSHNVLLRVLPASVFSRHLPSSSNFASVICVSEQVLGVARLEGLLPPDPNATLIGHVKRLGPPTDPAGVPNPHSSDIPAVSKVLNPSDAIKQEDVREELSESGHASVIGLDGVPEGQMIIVGEADRVEDWDVAQYVFWIGKWTAIRIHDHLYRLTISADSKSTKVTQDIPPLNTSMWVVLWYNPASCLHLSVTVNLGRLCLLMLWLG